MDRRTIKRLAKIMKYQYERAAAGHPYLIPHMDEADIRDWHFCIYNLPPPYEGGEYIFRLKANNEFPRKPPVFTFLTPNGVFGPGGRICISIGEFHAGDKAGKTGAYGWRPTLGMIGFAQEVVNGMLVPESLGGGIRIIKTSTATKRSRASLSVEYNNKRHSALVKSFAAFCTERPGHSAVKKRQEHHARARLIQLGKTAPILTFPNLVATALGPHWEHVKSDLLRFLFGTPTSTGRVESAVKAILTTRSEEIRRVLTLGLAVLISLELSDGRADEAYTSAFTELHAALPNVCGGACTEIVPTALLGLNSTPHLFLEMYSDLVTFLTTEDIDKKATLGHMFATNATKRGKAANAAQQAANAANAAQQAANAAQLSDEDVETLMNDLFPDA